MSPAEFREQLLHEQFGTPVGEWHPTVGHLIAAGERVRLVEYTDTDSDEAAS